MVMKILKKYKYQRLTKEEKHKAKQEFYQTNQGIDLKKRFQRVLIYSIILILFGVYLLIEAIMKKNSYAQIIYGSLLIIFGIIFLFARAYITMKKTNDFLTKPKKVTKK